MGLYGYIIKVKNYFMGPMLAPIMGPSPTALAAAPAASTPTSAVTQNPVPPPQVIKSML